MQKKAVAKKDKTVERQAKTIAKNTEKIDSLKKKNRKLGSTIRDLKAAIGRYDKSMKIQAHEYNRTQKGMDTNSVLLTIMATDWINCASFFDRLTRSASGVSTTESRYASGDG